MDTNALEEYKKFVKKRLAALTMVFEKAAVGDFENDIVLPQEEDEFTQLYVGMQVMLEVIREQLGELTDEIGHRRTIEEILRRREMEFKALAENAPDVIVRFDRNLRHVYINSAVERVTGKPAKEFIGKTNKELGMAKDLLDYWDSTITHVFTSGEACTIQYMFPSIDGSRHYESRIVPEYDEKGTIEYVLAITHDITDLKRAQEELQLIDRKKTEFLSFIAHQLRTPLGNIRWSIELLLKGGKYAVPQPVLEKLQGIHESNLRMIFLVNDLLDVMRIDEHKVTENSEPTDILSIIEQAIKDLQYEIKRKALVVKVEAQPDLIEPIMIDQRQCRDVMHHLLSNAVQYNKIGGSVTVGVVKKENSLEIVFRDTGIGIPPAEQHRIFEKFFRTSRALMNDTQGTGLGLYIVKSYVDRWKGSIQAHSVEGEGTTITVSVPLSVNAEA